MCGIHVARARLMHEAMRFRNREAPTPTTARARRASAFAIIITIIAITLKPSKLYSPRMHENKWPVPRLMTQEHRQQEQQMRKRIYHHHHHHIKAFRVLVTKGA